MTDAEYFMYQSFAMGAIAATLDSNRAGEWDIWLALSPKWNLNIHYNGESIKGMVYPVETDDNHSDGGYQVYPPNPDDEPKLTKPSYNPMNRSGNL
jgi:hypothetical protein